MSGMTVLVKRSSGDLLVPRMVLFGSPWAVAALTRSQRANGVLVGAGCVLLASTMLWVV